MSAVRDWSKASPEELHALADARQRERDLDDATDPAILVPAITDALGLKRSKLVGVVKYLADPPVYRLDFDGDRSVTLNGDELTSLARVRRVVGDTVGDTVRTRPAEWLDVYDMFLRAAQPLDMGPEATDAGLCAAWIDGYLAHTPPLPYEEFDPDTELPFVKDGDVYVFGTSLRRWLALQRDYERVTPKRMGVVLRAGGCEPVRIDLRAPDQARRVLMVWTVLDQERAPIYARDFLEGSSLKNEVARVAQVAQQVRGDGWLPR